MFLRIRYMFLKDSLHAKTKTPNQRIPLIRIHICLCCRTPASDTTRQGRTKPMNPFRGTPAPSCRTRLGKPETVADMIVPKPFKKHQKEARQGVQPKIRRAKTKTPNDLSHFSIKVLFKM